MGSVSAAGESGSDATVGAGVGGCGVGSVSLPHATTNATATNAPNDAISLALGKRRKRNFIFSPPFGLSVFLLDDTCRNDREFSVIDRPRSIRSF